MVNNDKNDPFEYHFLDKQLELFYVEDQRPANTPDLVALATIFIASLGLFVGNLFCEQRVKEVRHTKVLGSHRIQSGFPFIQKNFLKLVLIANGMLSDSVVGDPQVLQEYAYILMCMVGICDSRGFCNVLRY